MALGSLVEYLAAQEKSNGERLCYEGTVGMVLSAFPASVTRIFYYRPGDGEYAYIMFRGNWDKSNVPLAYTLYIQHKGIRPTDGPVVSSAAELGVDGFLMVTEAEPLMISLTNNTNLVQSLMFNFTLLVIKTKEDYDIVRQRIANYATYKTSGLPIVNP